MTDRKQLLGKSGSVKDLEGVLRDPLRNPVTIEEMHEAVVAGAVAKNERSKSVAPD